MPGDGMLMPEMRGLPVAGKEGRRREAAQGPDRHDRRGSGEEPSASEF